MPSPSENAERERRENKGGIEKSGRKKNRKSDKGMRVYYPINNGLIIEQPAVSIQLLSLSFLRMATRSRNVFSEYFKSFDVNYLAQVLPGCLGAHFVTVPMKYTLLYS